MQWGLHFAGRWAETPEGSRFVLAVLVRLVEKHPESLVEQEPCWQTQQPLGERRERENEAMKRGWITRKDRVKKDRKKDDEAMEMEFEKEGNHGGLGGGQGGKRGLRRV